MLAAARRQVGVHSDDGDDYGILIYTRPVMERPAATESSTERSRQSLGKELEEVLRRGGLALVLRLRGGRGVAVWAPYHQRPAQYQPRADADRAARANILAAWRAAGAPRLNAAAGAVAGGAVAGGAVAADALVVWDAGDAAGAAAAGGAAAGGDEAAANDAPGDEATWDALVVWDAGDAAGAAAAGRASTPVAELMNDAMSARNSRAARASTSSERAQRDAQRQDRDVQRAALQAEKRQKRHEQQQSHNGLQFNLVQDRDGQPVHVTLTTPEGRLTLPTWSLVEKLLKEHPSLAGNTKYKRFLTLSGHAFFADAVEKFDAAELVEHMREWQVHMMSRFECLTNPGAGSSTDAPLILH